MVVKKHFTIGLSASMLLFVNAAHADITGSIDATITLTSGCVVNGQNNDNGASGVDFGTLDFGEETTLFTQSDAQVVGTAAGIEVQCTAGVAPVLTFQAGQNDGLGNGAGDRAMQNGGGQFVTYSLFSDPGYATPLAVGDSVTLLDTGVPQTIDVYGRAYGDIGLEADTYTDVVTVLLEL